MKKYLRLFLLFILILTSCSQKKDTHIIISPYNEKLNLENQIKDIITQNLKFYLIENNTDKDKNFEVKLVQKLNGKINNLLSFPIKVKSKQKQYIALNITNNNFTIYDNAGNVGIDISNDLLAKGVKTSFQANKFIVNENKLNPIFFMTDNLSLTFEDIIKSDSIKDIDTDNLIFLNIENVD